MSEIGVDEQTTPMKVCGNCSVQSRTDGEFCPHCGRSYVGRRTSKAVRWVAICVVALLVVGAAVAGLVMKSRHDQAVEAAQAAAHHRAVLAAQAKAAAERKAAAKAAADDTERSMRHELIKEMQASITKDAKKDVSDGVIDGPILYTTCDPLGGGSTDDLTALTGTFSCLAVNKKNNDGTVSGYSFSATANWSDESYTWHLGN